MMGNTVVEVGHVPGPEDPPPPDDGPDESKGQPNSWAAKAAARFMYPPVASVRSFLDIHRRKVRMFLLAALVGLYNAYLIGAIHHKVVGDPATPIDWCNGVGFLIIITAIVYANLVLKLLLPKAFKWFFGGTRMGRALVGHGWVPATRLYEDLMARPATVVAIRLVLVAALITFTAVDSQGNYSRLVSLLGLAFFVILSSAISRAPSKIDWRIVTWGLSLQYLLGFFIIRSDFGRDVFSCIGNKFATFVGFSTYGSNFVYGYLSSKTIFDTSAVNKSSVAFEVMTEVNDKQATGVVFLFRVLPTIFFVSMVVSMLFHLGVLQTMIRVLGRLLQRTMGTTPCESMCAASNIFLGQTESFLVVKPFINQMTVSELHCIMSGGFATIAGSTFAAFVSFDISPTHLLSASFMSAPAALACAKMILPETEEAKTDIVAEEGGTGNDSANLMDAATKGINDAVNLIANIAGALVGIISLIAFLDAMLTWFGGLVGFNDISVEKLLGYLFVPFAWLMGVDSKDLIQIGALLGVKSFLNEFVAYVKLRDIEDQVSHRSKTIATYALCGFSNPGSVSVQLAGLAALAPGRREDVSKVIFRAFIAGSITCFMTACVAGSLIDE